MRTVLTCLTAKYIHSALAIRYLKSYCQNDFADIEIREFTINHDVDYIVGEIYRSQPDVLGLSCYIWNIEQSLRVAAVLKQVLPDLIVVLGGPEVSFDACNILANHPYIDYIICGEGELPFYQLLTMLYQGGSPDDVPSLAYRDNNGQAQQNPLAPLPDLCEIPSPYSTSELLTGLEQNKIVYYECSRGCPFRCAYCLSGAADKVRQLPLERVKQDLTKLIAAGVKQVNFVDRTFNFRRDYALEIFRFLARQDCSTTFHFEICADLLDDETVQFLSSIRPGRFQFEIGVQSTNEVTLMHINRKNRFTEIARRVRQIGAAMNIHQHLDLIAGLPHEDWESLQRSFDQVYELKPDMLQLGFLKLLKGSELREKAKHYGYVFRQYPPYEVLSTPWLSFAELLEVKDIEQMINIFYNSHLFDCSLEYLSDRVASPFEMYHRLARFFVQQGFHKQQHTLEKKYRILLDFAVKELKVQPEVMRELLKFDMLLHTKHRRLPDWCAHHAPQNYRQQIHSILTDNQLITSLMPHLSGQSYKQLLKQLHIEVFPLDMRQLLADGSLEHRLTWVLFDYSRQRKGYFEHKADYHFLDV